MSFLFPILETVQLFFLVGIPALILLQLWNRRSKTCKVPSVYLWQKILKNQNVKQKSVLPLWNRIFILQLILIFLLFMLGLSPFIKVSSPKSSHVIIVLNLSGSMLAQSRPFINRYERVKSEILDKLKSIGVQQRDSITIVCSPENENKNEIDTDLNNLLGELNKLSPNELSFDGRLLYNYANRGDRRILVTDRYLGIPKDVEKQFEIIGIKDGKKINVGWTYFNVSEPNISCIAYNFSDVQVKVDVELSVDGQKADFISDMPLLNPKEGKFFEIPYDLVKGGNLFEISLNAAGDSFEPDNKLAATIRKDNLVTVYLKKSISPAIEKILNAMGGYKITKYDKGLSVVEKNMGLVISDQYEKVDCNQLIISPKIDSELWRLNGTAGESKSIRFSSDWLADFEGFSFEFSLSGVQLIKPTGKFNSLASSVDLDESLILEFPNAGKKIIVINFSLYSGTQTLEVPVFPALIAKSLEELNNSHFGYYCVGQVVSPPYLVSEARVYQNMRKNSNNRIIIDPHFNQKLLNSSGVFSSGHDILCVNYLNHEGSDLNLEANFSDKTLASYKNDKKEDIVFDLKPILLALIAFIFVLEGLLYKNRKV